MSEMLRTSHLPLGVKAVYLIFILKLLRGAELEQPHEAEPLKVLHHRENETSAGRGGGRHSVIIRGSDGSEGWDSLLLPLSTCGTLKAGFGPALS